MSSDSALSHGKELHLRFFQYVDDIAETVGISTVEDVENFVEVVDNFPYLNLYPLLWKPVSAGERERKALKIHVPIRQKERPFLQGIQIV